MSPLADAFGERTNREGVGDLAHTFTARPKAADASPTVYVTDGWTRRRGEILAPHAMGAYAHVRKEVDLMAADLHEVLMNPHARMAERTSASRPVAEWLANFGMNPETLALRASCAGNMKATAIAVVSILPSLVKYDHEEKTENPDPPDGDGGGSGGTGGDPSSSVADAVESAEATLGGAGVGERLGLEDEEEGISSWLDRFRYDDILRSIMAFAGAFLIKRSGLRRDAVPTKAFGFVSGVEYTPAVHRARATERAMFASPHPGLRLLSLLRTATGRLTRWSFSKKEDGGAGPIIVVVDESGSMRTEHRRERAKGLALAMAAIARDENRWCVLVSFAGGTCGRYLVLNPRDRPPSKDVIAWALHFYGGGTEMDVPCEFLPRWYEDWVSRGMERGKADVILITDAICNPPPEMLANYREFAERETVTTWLLATGEDYKRYAGSYRSSIESIADHLVVVDDIDPSNMGEVLSIGI